MNSQTHKQNDLERNLLRSAANGDKQAFSTLYRHFYPLLTRFAYRYLKDTESIEEVVNDTLLTVWQKAGEFRGDSKVSTWIMGITMRKCWQAARKNSKEQHGGGEEELTEAGIEDRQMQRFDDQQQIEQAMAHLSADQRVCVELAYYSGYTCEEIGQIMDCPANTVKTRLFHSRKIFKKVFGGDIGQYGLRQRQEL